MSVSKAKRLFATLLTCLCCNVFAIDNDNILNVYNWSDFMPDSVIQEFEHETGIRVNYSTFDSNETMYAKLKADPDIGYDVIVPSSYYVQRMAREHMLHKISPRQFSNFHNLNPLFTNQGYDAQNNYSIPYLWGTTGIVINDQYWDPKSIIHWRQLWAPRFKNQLLMLDDSREVFAIALITLGYSINDRQPDHIKKAYEHLLALKQNIKVFNTNADVPIYADEDATAGMGWSGDVYQSMQENKHLRYIYPKDGFTIWVDCVSIPKFAPHYQNALKFLNFLMRPDIAKQITVMTGYSTPNLEGSKLLPKQLQDNPVVNPPAAVLKRGQFQLDLGSADAIYEKYWQRLKIAT